MITKIAFQPIPTALAILSIICACLLLNGEITPSGKYEFMAKRGFGAYQNITKKNVEWVKNDKIMGARLQSGDGTKELFIGLQKWGQINPEQNSYLHDRSDTQSTKFPQIRNLNYKVSIGGLDVRMKIFFYSQKKADELLNDSDKDERITYLNYIYKKCSKEKIVLLNRNNAYVLSAKEEKPISRFGLLIQIINE